MNSYPAPSGGSGAGTLHTCTFEKTDTQFLAQDVPGLVQYQTKRGTDPAQGVLGPPSYFLAPGAGQVFIGGNVYWFGTSAYYVARVVRIDTGGVTQAILSEFGDTNSERSLAVVGQWYPVSANDRLAIEVQAGSNALGVHGDTFGVHRNIIQFSWAT